MRTRRFRLSFGRRRDRDAPLPPDVSVTLSVLPSRTAVVVLDGGADAASTALTGLVEEAVHDAFVLEAVDVVEVRRGNGELVERRSRDGLLSA